MKIDFRAEPLFEMNEPMMTVTDETINKECLKMVMLIRSRTTRSRTKPSSTSFNGVHFKTLKKNYIIRHNNFQFWRLDQFVRED